MAGLQAGIGTRCHADSVLAGRIDKNLRHTRRRDRIDKAQAGVDTIGVEARQCLPADVIPDRLQIERERFLAAGEDDDLLWIVSDDGTLEIPVESADQCEEGELLENGTCPNKYLVNPARKTFRMLKIDPNNVTGQ